MALSIFSLDVEPIKQLDLSEVEALGVEWKILKDQACLKIPNSFCNFFCT